MNEQLKDPFEGNILNIKLYSSDVTLNVYGQTDDGSMLLKNIQLFKYKNSNSKLNPICDLDGRKNTDILIAYGIENFPAAEECNNYSTEYIPSGNWYLPSVGEWAYVMSRFYTIQHTLYMLKHTTNMENIIDIEYHITTIYPTVFYWTSTQYSSNQAYRVNLKTNDIMYNDKKSVRYVRAMMQY